jgi:hypothetical protein
MEFCEGLPRMDEFVLSNNPCSSCVGNNELCSLTDETEKFNAIGCQLISDWVLPTITVRKPYEKHTEIDPNINCKYCNGTDLSSRGTRIWKSGQQVRDIYCRDCRRRFGVYV